MNPVSGKHRGRVIVVTIALALVGVLQGCAVPSLGIRLEPLSSPPLPANLVVDRRSEGDKQTHYDPQTHSANYIYIADKDTIPDRMSLLSSRLASVPQFIRNGQPVVVDSFDILWDTSGIEPAFILHGRGGGLKVHTVELGSGVNSFVCTLRASVSGRGVAEQSVVRYGAAETTAASDPETGAAAQQCLDAVIQQWIDDASPALHHSRR